MKERDKSRVRAMEMKVLRGVAGVTRLDCVRNEEIRKRLKQEAVVAQVKRRREGWKDRVLENQDSIVEKVMQRAGGGKETQKKME